MYKLFYKDRTIFITSLFTKQINIPGVLIYNYAGMNQFLQLIECFPDLDDFKQLYVIHENTSQLFSQLRSSLPLIKAGGGIVHNDNGQILLIKRRNTWDLPKGKAEKGETAEETAAREVKEECHIDKLTIDSFVEKSYHLYKIDDEMVLKETHWFDMIYQGDGNLKPQKAEGITEVKWFSSSNIKDTVFKNTYVLIKELLGKYV